MKAVTTPIPGLLILEPSVFGDARGFFYESFNERRFAELLGVSGEHERCIVWDDPAPGIDWPLGAAAPQLSAKDRVGKLLAEAEVFA